MAQKPLGYTNYDYETLKRSLEQRLSAAPDSAWKDMYESGTGQMLIELFSAVGTLVLYYIERRAEESYIETAQNLSSVINLVRLVGYTPKRPVSAGGPNSLFQFTITAPNVNDITIPKWTSLSSVNGYNFLTTNEVTISYPSTSVTTDGIQGTLKVVSYTSAGGANQTYNIKDTQVENSNVATLVASGLTFTDATNMTNYYNDNGQQAYMISTATGYSVYNFMVNRPVTLVVSVNGTPWDQVSSFADSVNTSQHYVLRTELDQTVTVVFGNGAFGMMPSAGDIVTAQYVQSDGIAGNVYSTGLITTLNDTIKDADGNVVTVAASNITSFLGGDDAETIDDIRTNAPNVFATGQRAVTRNDFRAILKNFPGVADAIVFGENESLVVPDYDMFNQVKICVILQDWAIANPTMQSILTQYLYAQALITVRYSYLDPTIINIVPTLKVTLVPGASPTYVQSLINAAIGSQFLLGQTTTLGQDKYESDVVRAVEEVIGVDHCHITMKIQKSLEQGFNSTYDYAQVMDLLPAVRGKVELWAIYDDGTVQIGVDDGAGGWTALEAYSLTGAVDYTTTGLVGVNISPALPGVSSVYIKYQQDQDGDLITSGSQICKLLTIDYTSIS